MQAAASQARLFGRLEYDRSRFKTATRRMRNHTSKLPHIVRWAICILALIYRTGFSRVQKTLLNLGSTDRITEIF